MTPFTRRRLLVAAAATGLGATAGCGGDSGGGSDDAPDADLPSQSPQPITSEFSLIAAFPAGARYLAATYPQRLPFVLAGSDGAPLDAIENEMTFTFSRNGAEIGAPVRVRPHRAGLLRAYLPVPLNVDTPGIIDIGTTYEGVALESSVQVWDPAEITYPQIGNPIPSVPTPTATAPSGVDPICTAEPACDFHRLSLADSLIANRPIALLVSTPAYCQTAICGPVLDLLVAQAVGRDQIDIIHAEVYSNPTAVKSIADATRSPVVAAFSMDFEPAVFFIDRDGVLRGRLDTIFDNDELGAGLDSLA